MNKIGEILSLSCLDGFHASCRGDAYIDERGHITDVPGNRRQCQCDCHLENV